MFGEHVVIFLFLQPILDVAAGHRAVTTVMVYFTTINLINDRTADFP